MFKYLGECRIGDSVSEASVDFLTPGVALRQEVGKPPFGRFLWRSSWSLFGVSAGVPVFLGVSLYLYVFVFFKLS